MRVRIAEVNKLDGKPKLESQYRIGRTGKLLDPFRVSYPMQLLYDHNGLIFKTTRITDIQQNNDALIVKTKNTIYVLERID